MSNKVKEIVEVGDEILILKMINNDGYDDSSYNWRSGKVEIIDSANQIHGTWGGLALIPENDVFIVKYKGIFAKGKFYPG